MTNEEAKEFLARTVQGVVFDAPGGAFARPSVAGTPPPPGSTRVTIRSTQAAWFNDDQLKEQMAVVLSCDSSKVNIYVDEDGFVTCWCL